MTPTPAQPLSSTPLWSTAGRAPRPMLAREADAVYWMGRYVERAEHVARLLRVKLNLLADAGDLDEALVEQLWSVVPRVFRNVPPAVPDPAVAATGDSLAGRIVAQMAFDADNPNALLCCLSRARENARSVRETISAEMWEELNGIYWVIHADDARQRFDESPDAFLKNVLTFSMLFQGLADQTLRHDQRWQFIQLGKSLERIDFTCRVIALHWDILTAAEHALDEPLRNIHWMGLLRACCSIEAYRKSYLAELDGLRVCTFLLLEPNFPRSVRFAVRAASDAIHAIRLESDARKADVAQRILGRLDAQLEYAEPAELLAEGVPAYLQRIASAAADAALALQRGYFLH